MTTSYASTKNSEKRRGRVRVTPKSVHRFVDGLLGEDMHAKRVLSIALAVTGVLHAANLAIHAIGRDWRRPVDATQSTGPSRSIDC